MQQHTSKGLFHFISSKIVGVEYDSLHWCGTIKCKVKIVTVTRDICVSTPWKNSNDTSFPSGKKSTVSTLGFMVVLVAISCSVMNTYIHTHASSIKYGGTCCIVLPHKSDKRCGKLIATSANL